MFQIIRQTYDERVKMYSDQDRKTLLTWLYARDKYNTGKDVPYYLILNNYDKLSTQELIELVAERDIYETPDACTENK